MEIPTQDERYSKLLDLDASTIPVVAGSSGLKAELYAGKKVKIAKYEIREEIDFYPDGKNYDPNSKEKCYKVYLFSEPLKELKLKEEGDVNNSDDYVFTDKLLMTQKEGQQPKQVIINARFNLQKNAMGKPEISKGPKAKLWAYMRKLGANTLPEVIGKYARLDAEPSKVDGDDRKFLRLN